MRSLFISILLLPLLSFAQNFMTFGGGNYIYAEQDNLYFNLDQYVFDNRSWTYDGEKFSSSISVKMGLKTQYTNEWYESIAQNKNTDGFMYAKYIKQPFKYGNGGRYQKALVHIPALGSVVVGTIARSTAWNAFRGYLVRKGWRDLGMGVAASFVLSLASDSITCENDECKQQYSYTYRYSGTATVGQQMITNPHYVTTAVYQNPAALVSAVQANLKPTKGDLSLEACTVGETSQVTCTYREGSRVSRLNFTYQAMQTPITGEKIAEYQDLLRHFDDVCRQFPSECINEPTNGKNIKDVQLSSAALPNSRPISVLGPPYTHPITGQPQQDEVLIGTASNSGIGVNSATNSDWAYNPTLGQSQTLNPVQVGTVARPDLAGDQDLAPVANPNAQTGTKPANPPAVTTPDIKVEVEIPDFTDIAEFCQQNPTAAACIKVGTGHEAQEIFDGIEIPQIELPNQFDTDTFLPKSAACPAPKTVVTSMGTLVYSYEKHCEAANMLRPFIIILASIAGLYLIMKGKD